MRFRGIIRSENGEELMVMSVHVVCVVVVVVVVVVVITGC